MPLSAGTRVGAYEITASLGAGGMGEVYRARDTRLKREVALKILPSAFAADADRLARFQREAELLATLNHPNIAHIHGLEDSDGTRALVLELVEGPTLADRIVQGPIPVEEALPIARQIAEAVEAAHEQGIIHRDLKPANIKLRADGAVKVLDFGLAKALDTATARDVARGVGRDFSPANPATPTSPANSPTITSPAMTHAGVILGTAAYMSPEQAKGKPADKRADIWAFGVVLYEMLTGRAPFVGDSVTETIVALMTREPEWTALPGSTPARVREMIRRCLDRDHKTRLRDIGEARVALSAADEIPPERASTAVGRATSSWSPRAIAAGLVVGLAAGAAAFALWSRATPAVAPPRVWQVAFGESIRSPVISPDGLSAAFVRDGKIVVRRLDSVEERQLAGSDGAASLFWSPDSRSIGYFSPREGIRAIDVDGSSSRQLTKNAFPPWGAAWCDRRVFFTRFNDGLFAVDEAGRESTVLAWDKVSRPMYPACLPNGKLMVVRGRVESRAGIAAAALVVLDGQRQVTLFEQSEGEIAHPLFVPPDRIVFFRQEPDMGLWSLPVATDFSAATGPVRVLMPAAGFPSISSDGTLLALAGVRPVPQQLVTVDRSGRRVSSIGRATEIIRTVVVSPDGASVATADADSIWLQYELTARRWQEGADNPVWSPTSDRLAYSTPEGIFIRVVSGTATPRLLLKNDGSGAFPKAWSSDGRLLVFQRREPRSIWAMRVDQDTSPVLVLERGAQEPALSPDGRWLAFSEEGAVYVTRFPTPSKIWPVSNEPGARHARWNPRGGELFYVAGPTIGDDPNSRRDLYVAAIDTAGDGRPGASKLLFSADSLGLALTRTGSRSYDISRDGQHIVLRTTGYEGIGTIVAIQNARRWIELR